MRYNQKDLFRRRGSVASNGLCHPFMIRVMAPCLPEELPIPGSESVPVRSREKLSGKDLPTK